jgi:hypothetical protein
MSDQVRKPFHLITVDGQDLQLDHGPQVTRGLDMLISECVVRVPYNAGTIIKEDSQVQVFGGLSAALARTRFVGFAERFDDKIWPGELALMCKGALFLTERSRGADPAGTNLAGATRADVILVVMALSKVPVSLYGSLADDGTVIGSTAGADDTRFRWMPGESGLSVIQRYDEASVQEDGSAYRVAEDSSGRIYSRLYTVIPPSAAAYSFYETADDMLESSHVISEDKQASTRSEVKGFGDISFAASLPYPGSSGSFESSLLESSLISEAVGISAERISVGRLASGKFRFITAQIDTHRDDPIGPGDVIYVESDRMRVNQTFYVKNVTDSWDQNHVFTKKITAVSVLGLGSKNRTNAGQPFSTPVIVPTQPGIGPGGTLPPLSPLLPTAVINVLQVVKERVIRAGAPVTIYEISCEDASTSPASTIASRAWTASGTGAHPTSGTDKYFTVKFDGLAGTITLTPTDAEGNAGAPATLDVSGFLEAQVKCRDLFSILKDGSSLGILEAFDGHDMTWRQHATGVAGPTYAVANGPCWAVGDIVYRSDDYLRTAPDTSAPDAGVNVVKLWIEPDVNINAVVAALADGRIALSTDAGATWTLKDGPDSNPATWIILSRYAAGEIDLFSSTGFWQSPDNGSTWNLIQAGDFTFADLNPFRNWGAAQVAGVGKWVQAEGLTAITGTGSDDIRAVTSNIRLDRGYALAGDGSTWYLATDGATAATAGADIPAGWSGTVQDDVYRDGGLVDLVYFPFGAGGLGKTTDGFRAVGGYEQLRKRSVDGANAAGDWAMLGVGLLSSPTPPTLADGMLYVGHFNSGILYKRAPNGTWSTIAAATVGAGNIGSVAAQLGVPDTVYVLGSTAIRKSVDGGTTWSTIASPLSSLGNARGLRCDATGNVYLSAENTPDSGVWRSTNGGEGFTHIVPADSPHLGSRMVGIGPNRLWWGQSEETEPTADHAHYAALDGSGKTDITGMTADDVPIWCRESLGADTPGFFFYGESSGNQGLVKIDIDPTTAAQTRTVITPATIGANSRGVRDVLALDTNTLIALWTDAAAGGTGAIYRTTDGGASWTVVQAATAALYIPDNGYGPYLAPDPITPGQLYCLGKQNTIYVSTDGGQTWASEAITGAAASNQLGSLVIA